MKTEHAVNPPDQIKQNSDIFRADILRGLNQENKKLPSKYFYDKIGDRLFQAIMKMPEYYLTNCELDIFKNKTSEIAEVIMHNHTPFDLIELGAGDATKSVYLLQHLLEKKAAFSYLPIDISENILSELVQQMETKLPQLSVVPMQGDYFEMLEQATKQSENRKVVLFLGGNIGNMEADEALFFCKKLHSKLHPGDMVLMGFDLKKNPHTILAAYNDSEGITAAFNVNLLNRINRELHADFKIENFQHYPIYDPVSGACRSYLVSICKQKVTIDDEVIDFEANELIDMEISQKFTTEQIHHLMHHSGFQSLKNISDSKKWFIDAIWMA